MIVKVIITDNNNAKSLFFLLTFTKVDTKKLLGIKSK